jgi:hypothetical protein
MKQNLTFAFVYNALAAWPAAAVLFSIFGLASVAHGGEARDEPELGPRDHQCAAAARRSPAAGMTASTAHKQRRAHALVLRSIKSFT